MYRLVAIAVACLAVAACAGDIISKGIAALVGQPLSAAVAKLGAPTEERTIAGQRVYLWHTSTLSDGKESKCQIRVIMSGDVIGMVDYDGNEAVCMRYAEMLR